MALLAAAIVSAVMIVGSRACSADVNSTALNFLAHLRQLSLYGSFDDLQLASVVDSHCQMGLYHMNTFLTIVIEGEHLVGGQQTLHVVVMDPVHDAFGRSSPSSFAIGDWPNITQSARTSFRATSIARNRARRRHLFDEWATPADKDEL
ncbi:unnamed protein product (mitochondrion) [Plasmodiophora brassicae]|uniref:Uncharacterized protein n=1 Tax=Plasmodiophora brassicae TaxID=37360 RepID=A0A0G4ILK6_PLABS|nr:hypothetical protein PBRA_004791 [Plasmodiophora brassicae]SPQ93355.1 unnamed protein product [Plasmodiophora brassicae]